MPIKRYGKAGTKDYDRAKKYNSGLVGPPSGKSKGIAPLEKEKGQDSLREEEMLRQLQMGRQEEFRKGGRRDRQRAANRQESRNGRAN